MHLVACDRVSKQLCYTCRQKVQRLPTSCLAAWTDVWLESLATELLELLVGRRGIDWSWWRGGCLWPQSGGLSVLSLSISGCDDVSCTRPPRIRHMGESVTLTSPSCIGMQLCRCPVSTQGPCQRPDSPPAPSGADQSIRVQRSLSLVLVLVPTSLENV